MAGISAAGITMEKVKQFLEIAHCDNEDVAKYYLELSDGDLEKAIGMLYEDVGSGESKGYPMEKLTVLEWNIQGLLGDCMSERMQAIVNIIKLHQPSVLMLQEVLLQTYLYLQGALSPNYKYFSPIELSRECAPYFTAIFIDTAKLSRLTPSVTPFAKSRQGRQILSVKAKCGNRDLVFMTSHLESTKEGAAERKNQLTILYNNMIQAPKNCTVIFGGDTNLRDYEFNSVVSSGKFDVNIVNDVWSMLGSPQDSRYSWDLVNNDNQIKGGQARLRFERLYTVVEKGSNRDVFKPQSMEFVGTSRLECGMFPSDHWGILATFSI